MKFRQVFHYRIVNRGFTVILAKQHEHHVVGVHGFVDDDTLGATIVGVSLYDDLLIYWYRKEY